jgi:glucose/arabinose dehydrogenase
MRTYRRSPILASGATAIALLVLSILLAGCSGGPVADTYEGLTPSQDGPAADEPTAADPLPAMRLELAWSGFEQPLYLTHAHDGSERVFVVEKGGRVIAISPDGSRSTYLDVSDAVSTNSERGLLSIAFSPRAAADARVYLDYTDRDGTTVVSRMLERDGRADPSTEEVLLTVEQPYSNHNGGQLAFGPDGYLYVGLGDGGSGGDPEDNGQDPTTLLGTILRLDVSGTSGYAIPPDNPFAGGGGAPEVWAYGLRNPWRFSFDRETGDLWIGDVGQNAWEEIDFQSADSDGGENYGWRVFEGTHLFAPDDPRPKSPVEPVHEYVHDEGSSVTGGFVYRGEDIPGLRGWYVFGDYTSGAVWGLRRDGTDVEVRDLFETELSLASFGEDVSGELYAVDIRGGAVYRLVAAD